LVVSEKGDVEMKIIAKGFSHKLGFTLVEMLMAIAIIAVLVSLIIPALSLVHKSADMVRQKSQFHSIGVGLEAFRADFGDYPESIDNFYEVGGDPGDIPYRYCGAQKLAEAMIGHDGFGFHPQSEFRNDGLADFDGDDNYTTPDESLYHIGVDTGFETKEENLAIRKGPYLELETANAVKLNNLYSGRWPPFWRNTSERYVLADMFGLVKHLRTGKKTGMPILYYRANTSNFKHDPDDYEPFKDNVYDVRDNDFIVNRAVPWNNSVFHPMNNLTGPNAGDPGIFYENTLNPNFDNPLRPYRSDSFILLSAGPDGLYGTVDDVFNFERAE
jgi:prepilin-type N-terminal cleavage/methylation domain-containing protein